MTPSRKALDNYARSLEDFARLGITHETAVRSAFQVLLDECARPVGWKLVPEYAIRRRGRQPLRVDGALLDEFNLPHGYWEAKDSVDDLEKEIRRKFALGYPRNNILFQSPAHAVLYQNGKRVLDAPLATRDQIAEALRVLLTYQEPEFEEWERATSEFKERIGDHGRALTELLSREQSRNRAFKDAFNQLVAVCRNSLNPQLSVAAVEEMLVQHLLTWRIFKGVFGIADFMQKNVIAVEIEKVILTIRTFSREDFLRTLDRFYIAVERAAATIGEFSEKQKFLNTVYERFFQGFAVKQADTLGIVYTPQPLVDFMVASVESLLRDPFKKEGLAAGDVHILDGFTGTGNFIVNIMRALSPSELKKKYPSELYCNEVMLLPYYVASMNIEHEYYEAIGEYRPFEGICLVDTFQIAEEHTGGGMQRQFGSFNEANSERIQRQREQEIFVCIGNPPYNAGQVNENDNNKNRKYPELDARVSSTYGEASRATLLRKLADPYVKAIRWATDRIGDAGIVAFVNNNSFVDEISFDGMRHHLARDFDLVYVLDLGGNVRKNPKLSGTTHNVFGIQVGVSINFFIRFPAQARNARRQAKILYHSVPGDWRKEQKYDYLEKSESIMGVTWRELHPDAKDTWLTSSTDAEFGSFVPIGSREAKARPGSNQPVVFRTYSLGVSTNRDSVVYDFDAERLAQRIEKFCEDYNFELHRWQKKGAPADIDNFVNYEKLKWSRNLKRWLRRAVELEFQPTAIRQALYRPFTKSNVYFARMVIDEIGDTSEFFPNKAAEEENRVICVSDVGLRSAFSVLVTNRPFDLHLCASTDAFQGFPFYTYDEGGTNRRENIPLNTLIRFQTHYGDDKITRWDIFHYLYALLHHPGYRERFAVNLKRELPRIPFAPAFRTFAKTGKALTKLHVEYEKAFEYPLKRVEKRDVPLSWRVDKMKLTFDKRAIIYNDFLTLEGVPPQVFGYELGNRSALDWVINQYSVDPRSESDPNNPDNPEYIVRLIGKIVTVSLETVKLVGSLPEDFGAEGEQSEHDHDLEIWRLNQRLPTSGSAREQMQRLKQEVASRSVIAATSSEPCSSNTHAKKASRSRRTNI